MDRNALIFQAWQKTRFNNWMSRFKSGIIIKKCFFQSGNVNKSNTYMKTFKSKICQRNFQVKLFKVSIKRKRMTLWLRLWKITLQFPGMTSQVIWLDWNWNALTWENDRVGSFSGSWSRSSCWKIEAFHQPAFLLAIFLSSRA